MKGTGAKLKEQARKERRARRKRKKK